jgi:hypothetical protein
LDELEQTIKQKSGNKGERLLIRTRMLRQAQQPCFGKLSNHASASSATMLRHAQQPCFGMLSNHASACSATMLRHAQQPRFGMLSNHASACSATTLRQVQHRKQERTDVNRLPGFKRMIYYAYLCTLILNP